MQHITPTQPRDYSWVIDSLFLIAILSVLFFTFLGMRPLFVPDEGRYAEIVREMVGLQDYVTPHLNGIKYFEKPILFYWLGSLAVKLAGMSLWSIRSINALLGLLGCLMTYFVGRKLYNRQTGFLAAFILATSTLYFVMSHMISLDLTVTFFLSASLYAFLLGITTPIGMTRRLYFYTAFASAALAVLTKGLIGIVFPVMIVTTWAFCVRKTISFKNIYLPSALLLFLLIAAPWHFLVGERNPEFFYFYFIEQHFLRYTTADIGHYQPAWFFLPILIIGFFPWSIFLPQAILRVFKARKAEDLFFLLWVGIIFVFFSFSKSKLIPYILPIFPPLAILLARYLVEVMQKKTYQRIRLSYAVLLMLSAGIAYLFISADASIFVDPQKAHNYLRLAACVLMGGSLISFFYILRQRASGIAMTSVTAALFLLISLAAMPAIDARTVLPLAHILNPLLTPADEVVTFNQYYQDLPFYLNRKVSVLNWRNELTYGMRYQDTHEWMLNDTAFWQRWKSARRVFVVLSLAEYKQLQTNFPNEHFYFLGKTLNNVLISNVPIEQNKN